MSSYGQTLLKELLSFHIKPIYKVQEDYRPEWLDGLEIDLWYQDLSLGFEFQGDQHYYTPAFGKFELVNQRARDWKKKYICKSRGIKLIKIDASELTNARIRKILIKANLYDHLIREKGNKLQPFKKGIEYRKLLKKKYNSTSAIRKGSKSRKSKVAEEKESYGKIIYAYKMDNLRKKFKELEQERTIEQK